MHDIKEGIVPVIPGSTWVTVDKNACERDLGWRGVHLPRKSLCDCIARFFWKVVMPLCG